MPQLFPDPPSSFTGPALAYLRLVSAALRNLPHWSYASLATPNAVVPGKLGDRFFNLGSASTLSREWIKVGPDDGVTASTTSWVVVRVL